MAKTKRRSSAAKSSRKAGSNKVGVVGQLIQRGDALSVFAAELIGILQDKCWEYGLEIKRLKGD